MLRSLIIHHPFLDSNKRTVIVAAIVFLKLNGVDIQVGQPELVDTILKIESKTLDITQIAEWLKKHST